MVISKTPLRISFAGGGTDLPAFYRRFGGAVLSTTIDKYIYVTVNRKFDNGIRVSYSKRGSAAAPLLPNSPATTGTRPAAPRPGAAADAPPPRPFLPGPWCAHPHLSYRQASLGRHQISL
jgi:hypothetical protein